MRLTHNHSSVYMQDLQALEDKSLSELRIIAKALNIKGQFKKDELIARIIIESAGSGNIPDGSRHRSMEPPAEEVPAAEETRRRGRRPKISYDRVESVEHPAIHHTGEPDLFDSAGQPFETSASNDAETAPDEWSRRAAHLAGRGDWEGARAQWLEALNLNPDFSPALYNLGLYYERRHEPEQALEFFQKAFIANASPRHRSALTRLQGFALDPQMLRICP